MTKHYEINGGFVITSNRKGTFDEKRAFLVRPGKSFEDHNMQKVDRAVLAGIIRRSRAAGQKYTLVKQF